MLGDEATRALTAVWSGRCARDLESWTLDFKTVGRSVSDTLVDLGEAAACFANAGGGQIVVGIADRGQGPAAFVGADLDSMAAQRRIFEVTDPPLVADVRTIQWRDVPLMVITVPSSPSVHQVRGRALERVGTSCTTMTALRIAAALSLRSGYDWSAEDSGRSVDEIPSRPVEDARRLLADAPDDERRSWATASLTDLLRRLGVVRADGRLTKAGAYLFLESEAPRIQYIRRSSPLGDLKVNDFLVGPGITVVLRCMELVEAVLDGTPVNLPRGNQILVQDIPAAVIREAVVNAVMHRDHSSGMPVQVEQSPTVVSVTSPGGLVPGVTVDTVLSAPSRPRNQVLAGAMRGLGVAERAGVGIDRMFAEMTMLGHEPPVFEADDYRVTVRMVGGPPDEPLLRFLLSLPVDVRRAADVPLILSYLRSRRTVTAADLVGVLQKPLAEVDQVLASLSDVPVAVLERTPHTARRRVGRYRLRAEVQEALAPSLTYGPGRADPEGVAVDAVAERGSVDNALVREFAGVTEVAASRALAALTRRGVLVRTSGATRGPGVTYGAGPQFPKTQRGSRAGGSTRDASPVRESQREVP